MVPIVSIVGDSGSGKTTLICKLIPELIERGYRVGTVKHDAHRFEIDHPGKDSWRHKQAGAHGIVISSSEKYAVVQSVDAEPSLDELAGQIKDVDIILSEGYRTGLKPKIEVVREPVSTEPRHNIATGLFAVVSDLLLDVTVPIFGFDAIEEIADLIERVVESEKIANQSRCRSLFHRRDGVTDGYSDRAKMS